jgi:hypothetical protein
MPLGASIGPAGLAVMPYTLTFTGDFFQIAGFIHGIDKLVETKNATVGVEGRLVTIDGFSLSATEDEEEGAGDNRLSANFTVTTYITPPGQGVTAGASTSEPAPVAESSASPEPEASEAGEAQ